MEAYLDNGATTRCYPEVADLIRKTLLEDYGILLLSTGREWRRSSISEEQRRFCRIFSR